MLSEGGANLLWLGFGCAPIECLTILLGNASRSFEIADPYAIAAERAVRDGVPASALREIRDRLELVQAAICLAVVTLRAQRADDDLEVALVSQRCAGWNRPHPNPGADSLYQACRQQPGELLQLRKLDASADEWGSRGVVLVEGKRYVRAWYLTKSTFGIMVKDVVLQRGSPCPPQAGSGACPNLRSFTRADPRDFGRSWMVRASQ